jgi:chromosome transmission fidelity protein 1
MARINDECKELNKKSGSCCKFKRTDKEDEAKLFADFTDETHSLIRDIEDLALLGKKMNICPYYGARKAVAGAEVICVPYNLLLHKATRVTSNINLKNAIVIVDEAHNLIDSINSIHSIFLDSSQILMALTQLKNYYEKYKARLSAKNSMFIKQLLLVLTHLKEINSETGLMTTLEFVQLLELEHLNFFKLLQFLESSQLANKLQGFNEKAALNIKQGQSDTYTPKNESPIRNVASLLEVLAYPDDDGRILVTAGAENKTTLKYLLLNPSNVFEDITTEARSVILAGGTMEPMSDFLAQLLPKIPPERIKTFGCGHVISNSQLLPMVISSNENCEFQFGFEKRNDVAMVIYF